jgi:hypothetical protein
MHLHTYCDVLVTQVAEGVPSITGRSVPRVISARWVIHSWNSDGEWRDDWVSQVYINYKSMANVI